MFAPPIDPPKPTIPVAKAAAPRHTEASDAKMAIRHHEDQPGRKKDQDHAPTSSPFGAIDDDMVLSVQALIDFIENFIRTQRTEAAPASTPVPEAGMGDVHVQETGLEPNRTPQKSVYAANAYAHAAAVRTGHTAYTPPAAPAPTTQPPEDEASDPELRRAIDLLAKLRQLDARGIPGIHLASGPDFLAALEQAIQAAVL